MKKTTKQYENYLGNSLKEKDVIGRRIHYYTISFSCDITEWNELLKRIGNFLITYDQKILSYQIYLCKIKGYTVKLSLSLKEELTFTFKNTVEKHFKVFFDTMYPSIQPTQNSGQQYYDTAQQKASNKNYNSMIISAQDKFHKDLSDIIIEVLSEETLDEEVILSFCYYLHSLLLKVFVSHLSIPFEIISNNYQIDFSFQHVDIKGLYKYCKNNFKILYDVTDEVFQIGDNSDKAISWMDKLIGIYKNYIQSYSVDKLEMVSDEEKQRVHKSLILLINQHLGPGLFSENLLYYFINQVTDIYLNNKLKDRFPTLNEVKNDMKKKHCAEIDKTLSFCIKIDNLPIPPGKNELRLFVIARNESLRLPYFFNYYSKLGVDRFFFIDNNSTDNTRDIALSFKNVHLFKIDRSYKEHWNWIESFLNKYGKNRWCMVVDADELLYFPYSEYISLKQLIKYLSANNFTALKSVLLDIHSDKPIIDTEYYPNMNPIEICSYFDPSIRESYCIPFDKKKWDYFSLKIYFGGVRSKAFIGDNSYWFNLTKFSLFKYLKKTYLTQGMHGINGANIADIQGAVIHTKFLGDFTKKVCEESEREEHFDNAVEYKIYNSSMNKDKSLSLKNENSIKWKDTEQLIDLGIMKCSDKYMSAIQRYISETRAILRL